MCLVDDPSWLGKLGFLYSRSEEQFQGTMIIILPGSADKQEPPSVVHLL